MDSEQARRALDSHLLLMLEVARNAVHKVRSGGTLVFKGRYLQRSRTECPLRKVESASVSEIRIRINSTRSPSISRRPILH
jgi:hypothetical protein